MPFPEMFNKKGEMGTITDEECVFRFKKVPLGRHNIRISFVGYEPKVIP